MVVVARSEHEHQVLGRNAAAAAVEQPIAHPQRVADGAVQRRLLGPVLVDPDDERPILDAAAGGHATARIDLRRRHVDRVPQIVSGVCRSNAASRAPVGA